MSGIKVLDAGCGEGQYAFYLARKYPLSKIDGIELSEQIVDNARCMAVQAGLSNVTFLQADLLELTDIEKYDVALCIVVLEHIKDDQRVVNNCYRALKPGGFFLVHVPKSLTSARFHFRRFAGRSQSDHVRDGYSMEEISQKLQSAGFLIRKVVHPFGYWGSLSREVGLIAASRPLLALLSFPICMIMGVLDAISNNADGNGLLFFGVKPHTPDN